MLGLWHHSGLEDSNVVLQTLQSGLEHHGVARDDVSMYLVGGSIVPEEDEGGSIETESELLALRDRYNIHGAALHLSVGEYDQSGQPNEVGVVLHPRNIMYSPGLIVD